MGKEKDKERQLFELVRNNDATQLQKLLNKAKHSKNSKRLNVNCVDDKGLAPLHHAARLGHAKVIESLLESGARVDLPDTMAYRPLHHAAVRGNLDCIVPLLKWGADVNEQAGDGATSLHIACFLGHLAAVKVLVTDFRASLTIRTSHEKTPFDIACEQDRCPVVQFLLQLPDVRLQLNCARMADPNWCWLRKRKFTALHLAARSGHIDVLSLLVQAAHSHNDPIASNGAASSASASTSLGSKGLGSLSNLYASAAASSFVPVDINLCTSRGTALHEAAIAGHYHVVKFLVEHGINPGLRNQNGQSALDVCVKKLQETEEQEKRVQLSYIVDLLQNVAPTTSMRRGNRPVHSASVNQFSSSQQLSVRNSMMQPSTQHFSMFTSVQSLVPAQQPQSATSATPPALPRSVVCYAPPTAQVNNPVQPAGAIYAERSQSCDYIAALLAQNGNRNSVLVQPASQLTAVTSRDCVMSVSLHSFALPQEPSARTADSSSTNTLLDNGVARQQDAESDTDTGEVTPVRQKSPERVSAQLVARVNTVMPDGLECSSPSMQSYAYSVASQRSVESDSGISVAMSGESTTASPNYRASFAAGNSNSNSNGNKPNSLAFQTVKSSTESDEDKTPTVSSMLFQSDNARKDRLLKVNVCQLNALLATGLSDSDALRLFLTEIDLAEYVPLFANAGYDREFWLMRYLTESDLLSLGISNFSHRLLILTNLHSLSESASTSVPTAVSHSTATANESQKAVQRRSIIRMDFLRKPSLRRSSAPSPHREQTTLKDWLTCIKLADLEPLFVQQGYYTVNQLVNAVHPQAAHAAPLTDHDLLDFGIRLHSQRKKIFVELDKVRKLLGINSAQRVEPVSANRMVPDEPAAQRKLASFALPKSSLSPASSSLLSTGSNDSGPDQPQAHDCNDLASIPPPPSFSNDNNESRQVQLHASRTSVNSANSTRRDERTARSTVNGDAKRSAATQLQPLNISKTANPGLLSVQLSPKPQMTSIGYEFSAQQATMVNVSSLGASNNRLNAQPAPHLNREETQQQLRRSSSFAATEHMQHSPQAQKPLLPGRRDSLHVNVSTGTHCSSASNSPRTVEYRLNGARSRSVAPSESARPTATFISTTPAAHANPDLAVFEDIDSLLTGLTAELSMMLQKP